MIRKYKRNYTQVPNSIINDTNLSMSAKALWVYIASKPDTWTFSMNGVASQMKEGIDAIKSATKMLEERGLLRRIRERETNGKLGNAIWEITEESFKFCDFDETKSGETYSGKTYGGKTTSGKTYGGETQTSNKEIVILEKVILEKENKEKSPNLVDQIIKKLELTENEVQHPNTFRLISDLIPLLTRKLKQEEIPIYLDLLVRNKHRLKDFDLHKLQKMYHGGWINQFLSGELKQKQEISPKTRPNLKLSDLAL